MWEQKDCDGYLKTAAVIAAYVDQSISTNTFYNPAHFPDRKVPTTLIAKNLMQSHMWGLKTFYYSLINKAGSKAVDTPAEYKLNGNHVNGSTVEYSELMDDDCEACKL
jgi:ribonucleoside-diphosphate reductase alpha chain